MGVANPGDRPVIYTRSALTWGDGEAANVLIHRDTNDALDQSTFGGGWTNGWADRELSGTVEGDLMAVKKIREFFGSLTIDFANEGCGGRYIGSTSE